MRMSGVVGLREQKFHACGFNRSAPTNPRLQLQTGLLLFFTKDGNGAGLEQARQVQPEQKGRVGVFKVTDPDLRQITN